LLRILKSLFVKVSEITSGNLWLYLRLDSFIVTVMLVLLGHMTSTEVNRIMRERGHPEVFFG